MGRGAKFRCLCCGEMATPEYIKTEATAERMGADLMGIVAEGVNGRTYLPADEVQTNAATVHKPTDVPVQSLANDPRNIWCTNYGLDTVDKLFTNRQLLALTTFSELVAEARAQVEADGGSMEYAQALSVYLAFGVSRMTDINNVLCRWETTKTQVRNLFGRQAIPMMWDFAENNVFGEAAGGYMVSLRSIITVIERFQTENEKSVAAQCDAQSDCGLENIMISTDPPYYDNIAYADLSDFIHVWMRQSLKDIYPALFRTMLVPKAEELVATPYRFGGSTEKAKMFFEDGMVNACKRMYAAAVDDIPVTIYYAFKQRDTDTQDATASMGWETMLSAIIRAGFCITGT